MQREISLLRGQVPEASSFNLASQLVGKFTSASGHLLRDELRAKVQAVLEDMESHDREVLALRHFEELTIRESAIVIGITETAASSRYRRAIVRIKKAFDQTPGSFGGAGKS